MTGRAAVRDVTVCQWFFFSADAGLPHELSAIIEEARQWLGVDFELRQLDSYRLPNVGLRLGSAECRQSVDGVASERFLEVRLDLDCVYLLLTDTREAGDTARLAGFEAWRPPALAAATESKAFFGHAVCRIAEVDGEVPAEWTRALLSHDDRAGTAGPASEAAVTVQLPWGELSLCPGAEPPLAALAYHVSQRPCVNQLVYRQMTHLLLILVKFGLMRQEYPQLLAEVNGERDALEDLLKQADREAVALAEMEHLSTSISSRQRRFIEKVSQLEERLETAKINLRNLGVLLADPILSPAGDDLRRALFLRLETFQDQMAMDLRYQKITQGQAADALQSLLTISGVRSTQQERYMTRLLGIVGLALGGMGLAEVFVEQRFGIVISFFLLMVAGVIYFWWYRR